MISILYLFSIEKQIEIHDIFCLLGSIYKVSSHYVPSSGLQVDVSEKSNYHIGYIDMDSPRYEFSIIF